MSRKVEAWAWGIEGSATDDAGNWVTWEGEAAAHSHMADLEEEARDREEPVPKMRVVALVPFDPDAARVLKAAEKAERLRKAMNNAAHGEPLRKATDAWMRACDAESIAVERRQKRGAK